MNIHPLDLFSDETEEAIPLIWLEQREFEDWSASQGEVTKAWFDVRRIKASRQTPLWLPAETPGDRPRVLVIAQSGERLEPLARAAKALPDGDFRLCGNPPDTEAALLGWALAGYRFDRYKTQNSQEKDFRPRLIAPQDANLERVDAIASAIWLARDLINTPASDMLPSAVSTIAKKVAEGSQADFNETVGDALLEAGFGAIHAVGRASDDPPRLIDLTWGNPEHPKLTLVGKGVCFDSGGLDIKSAEGMRLMKKDMGGAAVALALGQLVMRRELPVRLRVLLPTVENAISGNAYRPGDILKTYKGTTVEIGNTDAEGRLVLSDALALACEESPELILDFATLTGAARIALGVSLPAMFASSEALSDDIFAAGRIVQDPVWPLPIHKPYEWQIKSKVADINNAGYGPYNGAIYAALFLRQFVEDEIDWAHFDMMAWNTRERPGYPVGGDAPSLHAVFRYLEQRYCP